MPFIIQISPHAPRTCGLISELRFPEPHDNALSTELFFPPGHRQGYVNPSMQAISAGKGDRYVQWDLVPRGLPAQSALEVVP